MPGLQHVTEVFHSLLNLQQLIVVGTVFLLFRTHFLGEGEGLSDFLHPLLKDGTH